MPPKNNTDAKKKARDDALQFLETLEIADEAEAETETTENAPANASDAAKEGGAEKSTEDPKSMLKFIDDLTESTEKSAQPSQPAQTGNWSWGGLWGQATALVEQNAQLKSGIGKLKSSIDQVRSTEASKMIEGRVKTLVNQENISKFSGELKRSLDTVMDTLAPPIQDHEVFSVRLVDGLRDSAMEGVVYRTMDSVFDFHGHGELTVKSAAKEMEAAPEMQAKRGDTFTLPKGFDGGYGAAVTAIQFVQHAVEPTKQPAKPAAAVAAEEEDVAAHAESPLFYKARKTELLLAIQPFSVMPIEDQGFLGLCVVLRDPSRNQTLRTFSQMLPLACWAEPRDQIVDADVDVALGSTVTMATDSAVQRKQEMNEECLYEAVMLAVKSIANEYLTMRPVDKQ
ncbi:hypothetical protein FBU59_004794 [Linderina macrospora]|uniref:Uncharacterized protein n=1 Tax=Linderina macrospora TaxID=4868 RepID=A0ACC1J4S3_9FUNG|nr:hypothetical protein FBU59_004794 [Linderina macrospora]